MSVQLNPYLNFKNAARSAMEFYQSVFGGELAISTFADLGAPVEDPERDGVMHSVLTTPSGLVLMASDTPDKFEYTKGTDMSVSLSGDDEAALTGFWQGLSRDATSEQPLEKSPWGDTFGMLTDSFGVRWLVNITAAAPAA